jgi:RNA polymerase sigma-70 factor (ECF subfamily)
VTEPTPSDPHLARRLADGDPQALTAWFEGHVDAVYAFAFYRVGRDPDLAADVTQSTFTRALERLDDYDPERGTMATWLRWLSRNIIRDTLAAHRKAAQLQTAWDNIDASLHRIFDRLDRELLPDAALELQETRQLVGMTLANLPPHYREVLESKYMHDHSLDDIATTRSTTLDSVKSMLRRARAAFRETFLTLARSDVVQ